MLKRQRSEAALCDPALREAGIQMLAQAYPDAPTETWGLLRTTLEEGLRSIDQRLEGSGPLEPDRFHLATVNERLTELEQRRLRS
jgi:hypothetical protein